MTTGWLLHTSAVARSHLPDVLDRLAALLRAGLLYTCLPLDLEALAAAATAAEHRRLLTDRRQAYRQVPINPAVADLALSFQARLAERDDLRAVPAGTLLVAATAQVHRLGVLHYDRDLDLLGTLCGVSQAAVLPLGSVP